MNVLVYNGPGVSQTSLAHTLSAIRALVTPYLSVRTVNASTLAKQPWASTCSLLVLPGGRDLPYVTALSADTPSANDAIKSYVSSGGRFLGICAGAYYSCASIEWEKGRSGWEVVGERPLGFYPGLGRGCVYPGFEYGSENGARIVGLALHRAAATLESEDIFVYYNGGGEFVDADRKDGVQVVGRYIDDGAENKIAAVRCTVGKGSALLWACHPEYPLVSEPSTSTLARAPDHPLNTSPGALPLAESARWAFLRSSLTALGIDIPPKPAGQPASLAIPLAPLPYVFATSSEELRHSFQPPLSQSGAVEDRQSHNTIAVQLANSSVEVGRILDVARNNGVPLPPPAAEDEQGEPKKVPVSLITCSLKDIEAGHTPHFNLARFFDALQASRGPTFGSNHTLGDVLLYSEAVESTQTLLDKNSTFASSLPAPTVALATYQLAGRGRGGNAWVSPLGQLSMSILMRVSLRVVPAHKLAFVQYLFSVAVVDACRELLGPEKEDAVKIKWPNDIYAVTSESAGPVHDPSVTKKLGGVLVSTSFRGNDVDLVIGCGLNVLNDHPTTSIASIAKDTTAFRATTHIEDVAAKVLTRFDVLWNDFLAANGSFDPFIDRYQRYWLHRDQEVTLTSFTPPTRVRIVGLEPQYGLLRTIPVSSGQPANIDLQPDGNSFDMFAGLIGMKV